MCVVAVLRVAGLSLCVKSWKQHVFFALYFQWPSCGRLTQHLSSALCNLQYSAKPYLLSISIPASIFLNVLSLILAMEIDFMGLYSPNPAPGPSENSYEPDVFVDSGIGSGEGNVSLSLCTKSPVEEKAVFRDSVRKNILKSPAENMTSMRNSACNYDWENAQPRERSCQSFVGKPVIGHSGFRYNRDNRLPISRNKFEQPLSIPASSTVFCPTDAPIFFPAQKADRKVYAIGDASFDDTQKSKDGYTPTVAMARKATLARFLKKRSHRLNQQIKPHLMERSLNCPEACDTTFTKCNKKIKRSMQYEVLR